MTIDRDKLAEVIEGAVEDWLRAGDVEDERTEEQAIADAVIAHLSAVPVEGEVEWGWRNDCGELRVTTGETAARMLAEKFHGTPAKRVLSEWQEVTP